MWNKFGTHPEACDLLERIAHVENPKGHSVEGRWGVHRPARHQGARQEVAQEQQGLLRKIPMVKDLQCAVVVALRRGEPTTKICQTFSHRTIRKNPRRRCFAVCGPPSLAQIWVNARKRCACWQLFHSGWAAWVQPVRHHKGVIAWGSWADCLPMIAPSGCGNGSHPTVARPASHTMFEGSTGSSQQCVTV